ncbi:MAG: phage terminase large subunit [Chloroflexota bacterium]|nr:phage terminase large subunit [Chloroflexota bacterium]
MAAPAPALYEPAPVQREFHLCPADEILFAGSAGPGKSLALLMDPIQTQVVFEHARWQRKEITESTGWAIHFRRTTPQLATTLARAHRILHKVDPNGRWKEDSNTFIFSCGYRFQFAHMKDDDDWAGYDSNDYTHLAFDELVTFTIQQYQMLTTRVRSDDPELQKRLRIVSATNPAPNWVREYFVDPAPEGRKLLVQNLTMDDGTVETKTRVFIPATLKDNPNESFRKKYEKNLQGQPEHVRRARLYGDWYVVDGAFFMQEFIPNLHVVAPFKIPEGWRRHRSCDWGYKSPGCVHWWAVDTHGDMVCYREFTFQNMYVDEVAAKIREFELADGTWDERKDVSKLTGPLDTQAWEERGNRGKSMAEVFVEKGVWWDKADKKRLPNVGQFIRRLRSRTKATEDDVGTPGIRFFRTCRKAITTIPAIGTDSGNPELPQDGGPDHWLDSTLYSCGYRTIAADSDDAPQRSEHDNELERARQRKRGRGGYWAA